MKEGNNQSKKSNRIWEKDEFFPALMGIGVALIFIAYQSMHPIVQADSSLKNKNYKAAYEIYKHSLAYPWYSSDPAIYSKLALCKRKLRDFDSAQKFIDKGFKLYENASLNPLVWFSQPCNEYLLYFEKGWLNLNQKDYQEANKAFRKALEIEPASGAYIGLAVVAEKQGSREKVLELYEEAFDRLSNNVDLEKLFHERAIYHRNIGESDSAIADLTRAVEKLKCPDAYYDRAILYKKQNKIDKTIKDIDTAIGITPKEKYYHERALIMLKQNKISEALHDINMAVSLDNSSCKSLQEDKERILTAAQTRDSSQH